MFVFIPSADFVNHDFRELLIDRFVSQVPMGFIGLMLMLLASKSVEDSNFRPFLQWFVFGASVFFSVLLLLAIPQAMFTNHQLARELDTALIQRREQYEMVRNQLADVDVLRGLGDQFVQSGQLSKELTETKKLEAASDLVDRQLAQMKRQIYFAEKDRNLVLRQKWFGGTLSAVVLAVSFVLLALTALA